MEREFFKVEKVRLGAVENIGESTFDLKEGYEVPESYGIYRTDNKRCLGVVGKQYQPVQNQELFDVVREAAELAGLGHDQVDFKALGGGRRVAFQVKLPDWNVGGEGDKVLRWASALNSHDGSCSLGIGLTGYRVFCSNTWVQAHRQLRKARHSSGVSQKVQLMKDELMESLAIDKELWEMFEEMRNQPYSEKNHSKFIKELVGFDLLDLEKEEKNTTQRENKFHNLTESINIELESAGNNLWGLFNGVTRFTNHVEAVRKDDPDYYLYFGGGKQMTDKALKVLGYEMA